MTPQRRSFPTGSIRLLALEDRTVPSGTPLLDSWIHGTTGENAKIINGSNTAAGAVTTWPGVTTATTADVTKVSATSTDIYVNAPNFASYVMGPWYLANGNVFPNYPTNQNKIVHVTLSPTPATTTHTTTGLGAIGIAVNGVSLFNMQDGFSWSGTADSSSGKGIWNRDANRAELATFDHSHAHQPGNGEYHYHSDPAGVRAQLDDNLAYTGTTSAFPKDPNVVSHSSTTVTTFPYEEYTTNLHHSPIVGWAYDGYPIYGPYGYSDANDPTSPVVRMTSSYQLRNMTTRTSLPGFAAQALYGDTVTLNANGEYPLISTQYGPAVSGTCPLGWYIEDYEFVSGHGKLDKYNGRFTKTPEYPNGTYAYFVTIEDDGDDAFPYLVGRQYYGTVTSGKATSVPGTATTSFNVTAGATGGSIRGVAYIDADGSASRSFTEIGRVGVTVFIDSNGNSALDSGEASAVTGSDGNFELPVAANGAYSVRAVAPGGYQRTTTNPSAMTVNSGNQANGVAFGFRINPPTVSGVTFGDGTNQRSMVKQLVVNFSESVTFMGSVASCFTLHRSGTGGTVGDVALTTNPTSGPVSSVTITFAGGLTENGSLVDGVYDLTISAGQVSGSGGALDGNFDNTPGGSYYVTGTTANRFYRFFGDENGDGTVDLIDFAGFRGAYNIGPLTVFDSNNDGNVGLDDFAQLRSRFGMTP